MMRFKVISVTILEVVLLLGVNPSPFDNRPKRDIESVVSSSALNIRSEKSAKFKNFLSLETQSKPLKFRWSKNDSFMEDLEDMFASIERELDEMLNSTKTKISDSFGFTDEFFSFSFSDSESGSASESEETPATEPDAEVVEA